MKIITKGVTVRSGGAKYPPGSTIDVDDGAAAQLIARGCATEAPEEAMVAIEVEPDGTMSPEIAGDGAGEPLAEAPPEDVAESQPIPTPEPEPEPERITSSAPTKPKRGKA